VDTFTISYRVADFLRKHPPFQAVEEQDLLDLAGRGRVRFHEANEYILWQGEPHKLHVFVIQQGTVSLWDEADGEAVLKDVRGPGDLLGIERFNHAPWCLHSARSASDVVIYSFPASDFETLIEKYPYVRRFVEVHDTVSAEFEWAKDTKAPHQVFLHDIVSRKALECCSPQTTVRDIATTMLATGVEVVAIVNDAQEFKGVVTVSGLLKWVASGAVNSKDPAESVLSEAPTVGSGASLVDGMLAMAEAQADAVAVTSDGSTAAQLQVLVTSRDISRAFGDQPLAVLKEIGLASSTRVLSELNHRARALAFRRLTAVSSLDWVARFLLLADVGIVKRAIALAGAEMAGVNWCFCGASGRSESLTRHAPQLVLILPDEQHLHDRQQAYDRVCEALVQCDYLSRTDLTFDRLFLVAGAAEWKHRYAGWLRDPVRTEMYLARPLFDLRSVHGDRSLSSALELDVSAAVDSDILHVFANDCLASLPPLTFFKDAVVEKSGEHTAVFRLEHTALRPLVDVGRVFGMAARKTMGTSTVERLALARTLLPEHASVFREASETLRILLWQQARIGIDQDTSGSELPPALLSRHDRHVLKGGFRSILQLLELTCNSRWFATP
jgi:CBS domain-containing protein